MLPVECLCLGFVNVYLVDGPQADGWALVDTGLPWHFSRIVSAAERRYGKGNGPQAIWLTHGHFDHVGSARALAAYWNVPVYAHPDELPYLTGQCNYPPSDPSACGGWLSLAARVARTQGTDLRPFVSALPETLPWGWSAVPLPGHTAGSVGFWHEASKTLLAGDALMTLRADTWRPTRGLTWPPYPFTTDWFAVRKSLSKMIALAPRSLACGHGKPLTEDEDVVAQLTWMNRYAMIARHGRYIGEPVRLDGERKPLIAPAPSDTAPTAVKALVLTGLIAGALYAFRRLREPLA